MGPVRFEERKTARSSYHASHDRPPLVVVAGLDHAAGTARRRRTLPPWNPPPPRRIYPQNPPPPPYPRNRTASVAFPCNHRLCFPPYNHQDLRRRPVARRRPGARRRRSSSLQLPQGHPKASTIPAPPPGLPWRCRPKIRLPRAPCPSPSLLVELIHGGHRARWRIRRRTTAAVSSRCAKGGRREDPFSRCYLNWAMILETISVD